MRLPLSIGMNLTLMLAVSGCRLLERSEPERAGGARAAAGLATRPPAPPPPAAEAVAVCVALQRRPLQRKAECCGGAPLTATFDACVGALDRALGAGALRVDALALERCAAAVERERSGCDWVTPSVPLPPAECRALVTGNVRAGGACRSSLECAAPLHCAGASPSEPGTCAEPLPLGAACARTSDALASLLMVDVEPEHPLCAGSCSFGAGQCQALTPALVEAAPARQAGPGEACNSDFDCVRGGCTAGGTCGMKCAVSLEGLGRRETARALVMTREPRAADD